VTDNDAQLRINIPVDEHAKTSIFQPFFTLGFVMVRANLGVSCWEKWT
jgi:hypothetical protein